MISLQDSTFYDLLPPNLRTPENKALAAALDRQTEKLANLLRYTLIYADIPSLSEAACDELARNFSIQGYESSMTLDVKRGLIASMIAIGAKLGTTAALNEALGIIYSGAETVEWFDYGGDPYKFRVMVDVSQEGVTHSRKGEVEQKIREYQNVRSQLEHIDFQVIEPGGVFMGTNSRWGQIITIKEAE